MTNSYINVEPTTTPTQTPKITAQEAQRRYRQGEFLRRNHHLISPWMYDASTIGARNRALLLMHHDMVQRPMKPLADGEIVVDELPA